jgi:prolyl-tRNA synthetase
MVSPSMCAGTQANRAYCTSVPTLLDLIQADMFDRARQVMVSRLCEVRRWEDLVPTLDEKCAVVLPWCENEICEKDIMKRTAEW